MLLVDPHVIGSHHEHVVHRSRFNEAEARSQPQHSANEVDALSIGHDIDVLKAQANCNY